MKPSNKRSGGCRWKPCGKKSAVSHVNCVLHVSKEARSGKIEQTNE